MSDQIPEATNNSGDSDYNSNLSEPTITHEAGNAETNQESDQTVNSNPAWDSLLSAVPEEFHSHLMNGLSEWDKGVQNRFQKVQQDYAPLKQYEEFAKLEVAPADISEAMQIRHAMQNDPATLFNWLQQNYPELAGQNSQGQQEAPELELSETDAFFNDPRYLELKQRADFAAQAVEQFNNQAVKNQVAEKVTAETKEVQEAFPGLDISKVAKYALGMAKNDNSMPDLMAAAKEMATFVPNAAPAPVRASDSAPPVISGGSRLPVPVTKSVGSMSSDERSAYVASLIKARQTGGE